MFKVEVEEEVGGRWLAEVKNVPGALSYGTTRKEALTQAQAMALRVLAERLENGEAIPEVKSVFSVVA